MAKFTTKGKKKEQWSGYWLDDSYSSLDLAEKGDTAHEALRLAGVKRAIANFVRIVTGRNIPVLYSSGNDSYTEGTVVVISASTKEKAFDSVVGLALHEASHNLLSNFEFLRNFQTYSNYMIPLPILQKAKAQNLNAAQLLEFMRFVMNVMEDRWIDYYQYRSAPGYRPYYESMYDSYFRDKQIDYAMQQGMYRDPTVESYLFHVTNMTNPWFDTRALPDLDLIYGIVDLANVSRFDARKDEGYMYAKRQYDRNMTDYDLDKMPRLFQAACRIVDIVLNNTDPLATQKKMPAMPPMPPMAEDKSKEDNLDINRNPQGSSGKGQSVSDDSDDDSDKDSKSGEDDDSDKDSKSGEGSGSDKDSKSGEDDDSDKDSKSGEDDDSDKDSKSGEDDGESENRKEKHGEDAPSKQGKVNENKLKKAIEKQKEFLDGDVKKKKVSKALNKKIEAVEQSGARIVVVPHMNDAGTTKTEVLVMRELTRSIMESGAFPFTIGATRHDSYGYHRRGRTNREGGITLTRHTPSEMAVSNGLRAGAILAQRLSIRNQNQLTKYNRRTLGSLDKRRLSALGFEDESVFYRLKLAEYKPVHLHMTIDASGSMGGSPWQKALTVAVAVAVAAERIQNLDLTISMRASADAYATIAIIYDSRKDKVMKIKQLFPYLCTGGTTPEGLTFAAIMNELLEVKSEDRYFINMSDGMPYYGGYSGEPAFRHTRDQVNLMKSEGIKVLSYFIVATDGYYTDSSARTGFTKMYGKDASFINVQKLPSLVSTLNKLFLQK